MGRFLELEKRRQAELKRNSGFFSANARRDGTYKGKPRPFCLSRDRADENLFPTIRDAVLVYFRDERIVWHDGHDGMPSNHLCDSQVCCVNFLQPFSDRPDALVELLRPLYPAINRVLSMEPKHPDQFVSFEWIGEENYLGEKVPKHGRRVRGANCTSADAAVMFQREDGSKQTVLIEWKYTESYSSTSLRIAPSGTDRTLTYAPLYEREDCPLHKSLLSEFSDLFYEPFYQFMRQQFLAHEMERAKEQGADTVSVLHIAPERNLDFRKVTSPALRSLGASATDVWKRLVRTPDRFRSVSTEELFGRFPVEEFPELAGWWSYINERYSWLR